MQRDITHEFKVGDKVIFGYYGYFDNKEPYTIVEVKETSLMLGNYKYVIENDKGHKVTAYADEIIPF